MENVYHNSSKFLVAIRINILGSSLFFFFFWPQLLPEKWYFLAKGLVGNGWFDGERSRGEE